MTVFARDENSLSIISAVIPAVIAQRAPHEIFLPVVVRFEPAARSIVVVRTRIGDAVLVIIGIIEIVIWITVERELHYLHTGKTRRTHQLAHAVVQFAQVRGDPAFRL